VLDEHVLISTSSSDQRDVPLARFPYNVMGRLRIAIRAAGPNHDRRPGSRNPRCVTNRVGAQDPNIDWNPSICRSMFEGCEGRLVVPVICREIHKHRDDDGAHR
jgi:hypothetical protein